MIPPRHSRLPSPCLALCWSRSQFLSRNLEARWPGVRHRHPPPLPARPALRDPLPPSLTYSPPPPELSARGGRGDLLGNSEWHGGERQWGRTSGPAPGVHVQGESGLLTCDLLGPWAMGVAHAHPTPLPPTPRSPGVRWCPSPVPAMFTCSRCPWDCRGGKGR